MSTSFLLSNATDLAAWAARRDAQAHLPKLVRRLILATVSGISRIRFPADESVRLPGWDGTLETTVGSAWVPVGESAWEMGTGADPNHKANDDYKKRTNKPLDVTPSDAVFVFVTPRQWTGKKDWEIEKRSEGKWRDVRAIDADDLASWLEEAPAVHLQLAALLGKPTGGSYDIKSFWEEWSNATDPAFSPQLLLRERPQQVDATQNWLAGPPDVLAVKGETADEAVAFLAATLLESQVADREGILWRSVVVRDESAWSILASSPKPLILIPTFSDRSRTLAAVRQGHHIFFPLGRDEPSDRTVELPRVERRVVVEALTAQGLSEECARKLAVSAGSLGALRRALAIHPAALLPKWANPSDGQALLPAILAGGWDERRDADRAIVAGLARREYPQLLEVLIRWSNEPDSPVRRIGTTWIITSKADAWALLSRYVTRDHLVMFENAVVTACGEPDPKYDLPPAERWAASVHGKTLHHSQLLRENLSDTIALLGASNTTLPLALPASPQEWADRIVSRLLDGIETWAAWASLGGMSPLLAEASPRAFLTAIEKVLSGTLVREIFTEDAVTSWPAHTEILWALESLAWSSEHLAEAALALAVLARVDPGGKTANRPLGSLRHIFLPWLPATSANTNRRLAVIDNVLKREPDVGWQLLYQLIPGSYDTATPTAQPRRRDWAMLQERQPSTAQFVSFVREITTRLVVATGALGGRWAKLIERLNDLPEEEFTKALDVLASIPPDAFSASSRLDIWNGLRHELARNRAFRNSSWALSDDQVQRLETLYQYFKPASDDDRFAWLFGSNPEPPEGIEDWAKRMELVAARQVEAVDRIMSRGMDAVSAFAAQVERPFDVGRALGKGLLPAERDAEVLLQYLASQSAPLRDLGQGFVVGRSTARRGFDWIFEFARSPDWERLTVAQRVDCFLPLPFADSTWDAVESAGDEACHLYWMQVNIVGRGELDEPVQRRAIENLLKHRRLGTAVEFLSLYNRREADRSNPVIVIDLLERVAAGESAEPVNWGKLGYEIAQLIALAQKTSTRDDARLARLEWVFLPFVEHFGEPATLERALATDPKFFVEVLKVVFKGRHEEREDASGERAQKARHGWELLRRWDTLPGVRDDKTIDADKLFAWVRDARRLASECDRAEQADQHIGQVLSKCAAGSDGIWPHEVVRELIEELQSEHLEEGIGLGIYNGRGAVSKSIGEGGKQERDIAKKYETYASALADNWYRTARLMKQIANTYEAEARSEDVRAELDKETLT